MPTTVTSLEDRVDNLDLRLRETRDILASQRTDFESFKGRIDTVVALLRWIGVFVAGLVVTILFSVFSFAQSTGRLESNIDRLKETITLQERLIGKQDTVIDGIKRQLAEISGHLRVIEERLKKPQ